MLENETPKMKSYAKRAQDNYRAKLDQINLTVPKGVKDFIIENTGKPVNTYIRDLVLKDLEKKYGLKLDE